jgi:multidrug resistance efflux pump
LSDAASYIGAIGTTEPPGEAVQIGAHVPGIVDAVRVSVGDTVEAGQALFAIEGSRAAREVALRERAADVARAQVEALRGQIPTVRAELAAARSGIGSAEARVGSAQAALSSSESDLANRENLLRIAESVDDARAISSEEIDSRRFAADAARARVAEARAQVVEADARVAEARASEASAVARLSLLVDASTGGDGPDLRVTLDRAAEADAAVDLARDQLALLTVRSPISGRVLQVNIRAGEFAPAKELTEGLVVIGRPGRVHVRAQIDEVDIARLDRSAG